jgi:hypothetical protein
MWPHAIGGREYNTFSRLYPEFLLSMSWTRTLSVNANNEIEDRHIENGFIEIRNRVSCPDKKTAGCANVFEDNKGDFSYGSVVAKDAVTFKRNKEDTGIFFKDHLIGVLGESVCRDSEIGKTYVFPLRAGSTEERTYTMAGCSLPQMVNGRFSSIIPLNKQQPAQRVPSSNTQSQGPVQALTAPPLASTAR